MSRYVKWLRSGLILGTMTLGLAACTPASTSQQMETPINTGGVFIQTPFQQETTGGTLTSGAKTLFDGKAILEDRAERTTTFTSTARESTTSRAVEYTQGVHMCGGK